MITNQMEKKYKAPKNIGEAFVNINLGESLDPDDPRYVETDKGRGDFNFNKLLKLFNIDSKRMKFYSNLAPENVNVAFCGHRGCGKSTELKRLASRLDRENLFMVIFIETSKELDVNNIQYTDVLMALAKKLIEKAEEDFIEIEKVYTEKLENWFKEKILVKEKKKEFGTEIKAGLEGKDGLPYLSQFFANLTSAFKNSVTYKEEIRQVIRNNFTSFAEAFNQFLLAIKEQLPQKSNRLEILFIIDDSEKWNKTDVERIFIRDVNQVLQIKSNFIYCTPISMLHESNQLQNYFETVTFPMIKIVNKDNSVNPEGYEVLRNMIFRRVDRSLFDSEKTVNQIIEFSGGNPRHVLQLLKYAFYETETDVFTKDAVEKGVNKFAVENYRRFLTDEHYKLLFEIDNSENTTPNPNVSFLLFHLALLEYNNFWWKSHPAIRILPKYKELIPQIRSI